ncbi:hypothetical protein H4R19_002548 [Coemansia spiralis]|nr:hypothetical protein H4R19_002548 [Coemansia spiralis]
MRMATNMLAEVMPRVQRLSLGGIAGNSVVRLLYGCVAAAYASQLQGIQCRCTINLPQGCWFAQLKDVDMNCSLASDYRLPQMSPGELTTLTLHYATSGRSWAPFSTEDSTGEIEFPKLKVLNVACHSPQSGDGSPEACVEGGLQTLHFPRLEILRIRCSVNIQPLLNCAVLPAHLNEIHIDAIPTVLALLSRTTLPAARRVVVRVESGHGDRDEMFASVCGLLERTRSTSTSSRAVELDIDVETIPVYARSITCTALTRLHVSGATRVDTMIALIRKLPNLNDLALFHVVADGLDSGPLLSGSGDKRAVPLSKTLRRCELMFAYEARLLDMAIPLVQSLLLRIPTLTHFISVQVPERPINEFVGAAAQRYPHLPAIKLSLGEGWDDYSSDYLNIVALVT